MSCNSIVLTEKEAKDFEKKKIEAFNGTIIICVLYGSIAIILLLLINFTQFGKEYIYKKFMPFVITYVIGAIFILFYMVFAIYNLEPTKKKSDNRNDLVCPDYWKLVKTGEQELLDIKNNNFINNINKNILDNDINYKCQIDTKDAKLIDYNISNSSNGYKSNKTNSDYDTPDFLYINYNDKDEEMRKYAQISGIYKSSNDVYKPLENSVNSLNKFNNTKTTISPIIYSNGNYPLICNQVYPKYLEKLDAETVGGNKYRCEYAKKCNIPWNNIGCDI
jgi:hypothetical protein